MVPRERALLRRPGREEGDALRSRGLCWRLMSLDRLGGGARMKESARSGESKEDWLLKGGAAEVPARYLQHKSNVIVHYLKSQYDNCQVICAKHTALQFELKQSSDCSSTSECQNSV